MPTPILMPALSPTMEKGNLAKWLVKEGDAVTAGDVIAEIETDKATMEVEAVDEGTIGKILVAEGTEDVAVNQTIAVLLEEGEDASAIEAASTAPATKPATAEPEAPKEPAPAPAETAPAAGHTTKGPATNGPSTNGSAAAAHTRPAQSAKGDGERIFASPLAKRLAAQGGIDLAAISGSGPRGRIVKRDVDEAIAGGGRQAPTAATPQAAAPAAASSATPAGGLAQGMSEKQIRALYEDGSYKEIAHDGMRKVIAERLTESKQTIPHFYLTIECELDALLALRKQLNGAAPKDGDGNPAYKLSVNDFVIKAMALALQAVPMANATWTTNARLIHEHSDVGVAVAIPDGLFTPVIRKAETKTLSAISAEMKDLAARARNKRLAPHEYQGGTTSISNLGMFGIKEFSAVINPPHGTILAVGAGEQRAVVKDGSVQIATIMSATLSCDHRVVDGALGAELLGAFKRLIENPLGMLV